MLKQVLDGIMLTSAAISARYSGYDTDISMLVVINVKIEEVGKEI